MSDYTKRMSEDQILVEELRAEIKRLREMLADQTQAWTRNDRIAAAVEAGPCTCVSLLHYRCLRCTFLAAAEQTETETN